MSEIDEMIRAAVGGSYEMPDGRKFWVDHEVAREISKRVQCAFQQTDRGFHAMLKDMNEAMKEHPWWSKVVEGTPLENDIPVRAAIVALRVHPRTGSAGRDETSLLNESAEELAFMHRLCMERWNMEEPIGRVVRIIAKIQEHTGHITDSPYPIPNSETNSAGREE